MPGDTLFPESAELLGQAGAQTSRNAEIGQKAQEVTMRSGDAGADRTQSTSEFQQNKAAAQKLQQYKIQQAAQGKMTTITPQIALGMVKNTGEKEWLKAIGQQMNTQVLLAMYTHGIKTEQAKKAPKITQIYDSDGKVRHAVVYTDEQGNQQQLMLDPGMTPEQLNKGKSVSKGGGKGGGAGADETFKKNKEFIRAYEKARGELSDPIKAKELQATNPDQYNEKTQWLKDNQDQYDQLVRGMGKAGQGEGSSAPPSSPNAEPDNEPFDADAFIKEALGRGK